ncbi:transcriptional regulator [Colletotrichum asianum]|uniref:Transcriptional n=1 Tax=Colletotrichum asianum TaxID=702518 RepID=A0A8H3WB46_9PEZI|nr:transcriptional [Colletotrichum asianum]
MFISSAHAETRIPVLRQLIRDYPLGVLTTAIPSDNHPLILASHVPFVLDVDDDKAMIEAVQSSNNSAVTLEQEVLVLFTAAPHHYVTPKFYTETKPTTAKVVPTWNYAAVQAYGRATIHFDSKHTETSVMDYTGKGDRPGPWKVADAPERYIELMKKNIISIEIVIERLEGKFKMSQEMRKGDREGVIRGFQSLDSEGGQVMADLVKERSDLKESAKQ